MKQVREGYKMTELGEIPIEWEVDKLGNLVHIRSGVSPSKIENLSNEGCYPFYKVNDFNFSKKYLTKAIYNFDEMIYQELTIGTIIFPKRGASIFTNKIAIIGKSGYMDTNLMALEIIDETKVNNEYFYYLLFNRGLVEFADTSAIPQINNKHIEPLEVSLPPLNEQQKIAEILSTVDEQIENIEQLIDKTKELKRGLMQQLLTKGIGHTEFKQTELGEIPVGWEEKSIGQLIKFEGGQQPPRKFFSSYLKEGYIRLIQIRDYKTDKYLTYIPKDMAKRFCNSDDIMIGRYGPPIFQILRGLEGSYNVALIKAVPNKLLDKDYAFYYLSNERLFGLIDRLSQRSSGQTGIDMEALKAYPLPLPSIEEQKMIVRVLSTIDSEIESYEQEKQKYLELKKGLMQQLLTGRMRVTV